MINETERCDLLNNAQKALDAYLDACRKAGVLLLPIEDQVPGAIPSDEWTVDHVSCAEMVPDKDVKGLQAEIDHLRAELDRTRLACMNEVAKAMGEQQQAIDEAFQKGRRYGFRDATKHVLSAHAAKLVELARDYRRRCADVGLPGSGVTEAMEALKKHAYNNGVDP